jgi:hypothetical protein
MEHRPEYPRFRKIPGWVEDLAVMAKRFTQAVAQPPRFPPVTNPIIVLSCNLKQLQHDSFRGNRYRCAALDGDCQLAKEKIQPIFTYKDTSDIGRARITNCVASAPGDGDDVAPARPSPILVTHRCLERLPSSR